MIRYIENINISFRYWYIVSSKKYRIFWYVTIFYARSLYFYYCIAKQK